MGREALTLEAAVADDHPKVSHLSEHDLVLDLYVILADTGPVDGIAYSVVLPAGTREPVLVICDADRDIRRFRLCLTEDLDALHDIQQSERPGR